MPAYANTASTTDFVHKASIANMFEIESSKVALNKSKDSKVKEFAQQMVDDHTKAGDKLKETLKSSKVDAKPENSLDDKHEKMLEQLKSAKDTSFDSQYINMQRDAHKEAVDLFGSYSKEGDDNSLKDFAAQTLPTLKEHLSHVKNLSK